MIKVGILYICTGKYSVYWNDFYESCERNFLMDVEKHYYIWTDDLEIEKLSRSNDRIHLYKKEVEPWPFPTLKRFQYFLEAEADLMDMDYIMYMNANLVVHQMVSSSEILPQGNERLFVTLHPGFFDKARVEFTYDDNPKCSAYVPQNEGTYYFAGGFNGGRTKDFLELSRILNDRTMKDYQKDVIAKWHDESQINRYMIDYDKPYRIISPAYLYSEMQHLPFVNRIEVLDKNLKGGHDFLRE